MSDYQCIELSERDNVAVVRLVDEKVMDPERIQQLGNELLSLAKSGQKRNLLINMQRVKFLSSSAINKLIVLERRIADGGGKVRLSNLSNEVEEVFNITQLNSVFDIRPDEDEALAAFSGNGGD